LAGKQHLIVVPTGALTSIPFQVLVTRAPDPSLPELEGYRRAAWLARQYAVSTLPGVASLKSVRDSAGIRLRAGLQLIGFGDPDFSQGVPPARTHAKEVLATIGKCAPPSRLPSARELPRLADTRNELRSVRETLGVPDSDIHLGKSASEGLVRQLNESGALASYKIVYFATHGLVTGEIDGLLEPAVALTMPPNPSRIDDGLLKASEITQLRLNADLVVLSACNTAAGRRPGEETLSGLARAFLYAGARSVLVSHWAVDSYAATKLATTMFKALADDPDLGRAEALRRALLHIVDREALEGSHPSYWAPFVVVGDGLN
jgi:CHAT domain-containing protein